MSIRQKIYQIILIYILGWFITACDGMDATYKEFLEGGEIVYPGKADSLQAFPGDYRIKLSWKFMDPSLTLSKVFWNNRKDSMELQLEKTQGIGTANILLTDMEERDHIFEVYNYDNDGNKSAAAEVLGTVYGDKYRNSLLGRGINSISLVDDHHVLVTWGGESNQSLGEEITYTDNSGNSRQFFESVDKDISLLEDFKFGSDLSFRTLFLPDTLAIDTFYSVYEQVTVNITETEVELDRSNFQLYKLPGDYSEAHNTSTYVVDHIFENSSISNSPCYISKAGFGLPQWFTIDLDGGYKLTKIKLYQRGNENGTNLYQSANIEEFEIWGAFDPDPNYNPNEHGGDFDDSWWLLQKGSIKRPSGNTENTGEDIAAAIAGHEFILDNAEKIRYIRIKALKTFGNASNIYLSAIKLWGVDKVIVINENDE